MKCIVTGGAGFVGSHLVDRLVDDGHEVIVLDNLSTGKESNLNPKAEFYLRDVSHDSDWYALGDRSVDCIFHLAALARIQPSFDKPVETHDANVNGTLQVLEYARHHGCKVVYAGTSSMYHDPYANPYTFTKGVAEQYCQLYNVIYGVPVAIARFFNVYGPRQLEEGAYATVIGVFERQKRNNEPLTVTGTGEKRRDFTHVNDIITGLCAMSEDKWNCEIFNLGTGKNYSINELAELFGHPKTYIADRPGEAETTLAQIGFTKEKLGWTHTIELEDYVKGLNG